MIRERSKCPVDFGGLPFYADYEYEPAEPQTWDDPGCPSILTITGMWFKADTTETNFLEYLDPGAIQKLTEYLREKEDHE